MNPPVFPRRRTSYPAAALAVLGVLTVSVVAVDLNGNGLSDIWELVYGASALTATGDADGDGVSNQLESIAGTNPFDASTKPALASANWSASQFQLGYGRVAGKRYRIESKTDLSLPVWMTEFTEVAQSYDPVAYLFPRPVGAKFWRLRIDDVDGDGDGLTDAEERWLGFDPTTDHSERNDSADLARVTAGLSATSTVTLGVLASRMSTQWPDPGIVVVRRSGGLKPITVNVAFGGTAMRNVNYTTSIAGGTVTIPLGVREVPMVLTPVNANDPTRRRVRRR